MEAHLLDGTYELFRHYYAVPSYRNSAGEEVGAVRGVIATVLTMLEEGATHLGVATDHVIESFRNQLWPGYKTGAGVDPDLLRQFSPLEEALEALGVRVWAMVDQEADDALAAAATRAAADPRVERVFICTPDKDLAQCVADPRIVQLDRRSGRLFDEAGVRQKFGVSPASIPDWLGLVGDSADGFPGLRGWGAKSAAAVLARYEHLEAIPERGETWDVQVRGAGKLAATLVENRALALLFRDLATLRRDAPVGGVDEWRWRTAAAAFPGWAERLGLERIAERVRRLADRRTG
jgi:5'-3' exonuclease